MELSIPIVPVVTPSVPVVTIPGIRAAVVTVSGITSLVPVIITVISVTVATSVVTTSATEKCSLTMSKIQITLLDGRQHIYYIQFQFTII